MKHYASALLFVGLAAAFSLLTQAFRHDFPAFAPFFFFGAVALAAQFGNLRSSLLALAISLVLLNTAFPPPHTSAPFALVVAVRSILFAAVAAYVCFLAHGVRSASQIRSRLAAIVESSDDAIVSKDLNGIVQSWNPGAERIFGYKAGEMIGRPILTIIPEELRADEERILATIARGERIEHFETVRLSKCGERVDVSLTISPMRDEQGRVIGASKIARDITEKLRMQQAVIQSEKLSATGRMAAAIAHEINNPLEAITNLAYLLSTDATISSSGKQMAALLLDEIGRMSEVTRQSLAFFRDSSKPSRFDPCEIVETLIRLNEPLLNEKSITLEHDAEGSCGVYGSPGEIRQVFANLLRNALDAVEPGGRIHIRIRSRNSEATRILVADNGTGIPAGIRRRLYQPFVTSKGAAGNGLGLWVSRGIVLKNGGRMLVKSSCGPRLHGTVFVVELPRDAPAAMAEPMLAGQSNV